MDLIRSVLILTLQFLSPAAGQFVPVGFVQRPPIRWIQTTPKAENSGATSIAVTFSALPKAGNTIILYVNNYAGNLPNMTNTNVSDNNSNSWSTACSNAGTLNGFNTTTAIFYAKNITVSQASFTVTVNFALISDHLAAASEYAGLNSTTPIDQSNITSFLDSSTTSATSGNATTTAHHALVTALLSVGVGTATAITQTATGFISRMNSVNLNGDPGDASERIVHGTGTYSAAWTLTGGDRYRTCVASFK